MLPALLSIRLIVDFFVSNSTATSSWVSPDFFTDLAEKSTDFEIYIA